MDENSKQVLILSGVQFEQLNEIEGQFIPREQLLSDLKCRKSAEMAFIKYCSTNIK
jgi:hypothetical protein